MKNSTLLLLMVGLVILGVLFLPKQTPEKHVSPKPTIQPTATPHITDFTASFAIYTHGTFRTFTDKRYHNLDPRLYIDPAEPNVVHVKKPNATWSEFFATLPMQLTPTCLVTGTKQTFCTGSSGKLRFFINGVETPDALNKVILEGDQLLVTFGNATDAQIREQMKQIP